MTISESKSHDFIDDTAGICGVCGGNMGDNIHHGAGLTFDQWWYDYRIKNGINGTARAKKEIALAAWNACLPNHSR